MRGLIIRKVLTGLVMGAGNCCTPQFRNECDRGTRTTSRRCRSRSAVSCRSTRRRCGRTAPAGRTSARSRLAWSSSSCWRSATMDNEFGTMTRSAVKKFQQSKGIPPARIRRPEHLDQAGRGHPRADPDRALPAGAGGERQEARRALRDRRGPVHRQEHPQAAVRRRRCGEDAAGRAVRCGEDGDPRGQLHGRLEEPEPRLQAVRLGDAVRDVLQRRPGGALLVRLRGPRLQRRLARLRERPGPGQDQGPVRARSRSATR